ncbi:thiamine-phosphate pyrophosphorylase [Gelidibacter sediminis]|uniref:Thiamine-phosphate pyrophosphorylase n=1 Tax=Gelidibacter sediminis TaxID=1608710 RepID=A0A4R7PZG8_9FLAO|nr:thiamine phosphate synthase [Gelidibacter sediminis]TDU40445.1 thiamine-phosphate pyrophosphorylase [Gelidibacter sediminis]
MSTLPKLHYISQGNSPEAHLSNIKEACIAGVELVELRLGNLDELTLLHTAEQARAITGMYQTRLVIGDAYSVAKTVKADGVLLSSLEVSPLIVRENLHGWQSIGVVANTLEDCKFLLDTNVDYIRLGPYGIEHQDGTSAIRLKDYETLLQAIDTETPILTFGNIQLEDVPFLMDIGLYGIAVSDMLTKDFKKVPMLQKLLGGASTQEQAWNANDWV